MRFEGYPPPDFARLLEDEFECVVVNEPEEEQV
jgi:hypothetical protein